MPRRFNWDNLSDTQSPEELPDERLSKYGAVMENEFPSDVYYTDNFITSMRPFQIDDLNQVSEEKFSFNKKYFSLF